MPLEPVLTAEAFEAADDAVKPFYKPTEDKSSYEIDVDFSGLKSALQKEREAREKAEKDYKETVKKYGTLDPEKYTAYEQRIREIEEKELENARNWEELKTRALTEREEAVKAAVTPLSEKLTFSEQRLKQVLITNEILTEAAKQGAFEESLPVFAELAARNASLEFEEAGAGYKTVIKEGMGSSISELVASMKNQPTFGVFFKADVPAGSGAPPHGKPTGSLPDQNKKRSEMTLKEKSDYIDKFGGRTRLNPNVPSYNELPD